MTSTVLDTAPPTAQPHSQRRGDLAAALQEPFTVAVRLRANRQVAADAAAFRSQIKQLLATADHEARQAGYDAEYVRLAVYAFVAFLDESVLSSGQPMFANWPRQPLQEELFGDHVAGETFFLQLEELLGRQDSEDLVDLLEVYLLCLLLGFRGRYGTHDPGGLQAQIWAVQEKIRRYRGAGKEISPAWAPPNEALAASRDPWLRRLGIAAAASFGLALLLFFSFKVSLNSGVAELRELVTQLVR